MVGQIMLSYIKFDYVGGILRREFSGVEFSLRGNPPGGFLQRGNIVKPACRCCEENSKLEHAQIINVLTLLANIFPVSLEQM